MSIDNIAQIEVASVGVHGRSVVSASSSKGKEEWTGLPSSAYVALFAFIDLACSSPKPSSCILSYFNQFEWPVMCDLLGPVRITEYLFWDSDIQTKSE